MSDCMHAPAGQIATCKSSARPGCNLHANVLHGPLIHDIGDVLTGSQISGGEHADSPSAHVRQNRESRRVRRPTDALQRDRYREAPPTAPRSPSCPPLVSRLDPACARQPAPRPTYGLQTHSHWSSSRRCGTSSLIKRWKLSDSCPISYWIQCMSSFHWNES